MAVVQIFFLTSILLKKCEWEFGATLWHMCVCVCVCMCVCGVCVCVCEEKEKCGNRDRSIVLSTYEFISTELV